MASEYTEHFNLDLYTDNDRPNLRDQYNAAIRKIDNKLFDQVTTINLLDSVVDNLKEDVEQMQTDLTNEVTARTNADTALGTRIDNETTARESADQTLTTNLAAEVTAREGADTTLDNKITAETTARTNADNALDDRIDGVAADVDSVTSNLATEVTNRTNADTQLSNRIVELSDIVLSDLGFRGNLLCFGDSWLGGGYNDENGYHDGSETVNWGYQLSTKFHFNDYKRFPRGSAGYVQAYNGETFLTKVQQSVQQLDVEYRLKVGTIVFGDAGNDTAGYGSAVTSDSINYSVTQIMSIINQYYPNAHVYVFPAMCCPDQVNSLALRKYSQVKSWIVQAFTKCDSVVPISVCDAASRWQYGLRYLYTNAAGNLNHPTPLGHELIANNMAGFMTGGNTEPYYTFDFEELEWGIPDLGYHNLFECGIEGNQFFLRSTLKLTNASVGSGVLCNLKKGTGDKVGLCAAPFNKVCGGILHDTATPFIMWGTEHSPSSGSMNPHATLNWDQTKWPSGVTPSTSAPKFIFVDITSRWGY